MRKYLIMINFLSLTNAKIVHTMMNHYIVVSYFLLIRFQFYSLSKQKFQILSSLTFRLIINFDKFGQLQIFVFFQRDTLLSLDKPCLSLKGATNGVIK